MGEILARVMHNLRTAWKISVKKETRFFVIDGVRCICMTFVSETILFSVCFKRSYFQFVLLHYMAFQTMSK